MKNNICVKDKVFRTTKGRRRGESLATSTRQTPNKGVESKEGGRGKGEGEGGSLLSGSWRERGGGIAMMQSGKGKGGLRAGVGGG